MRLLFTLPIFIILITSCQTDLSYSEEQVIGEWHCVSFDSEVENEFTEPLRAYNLSINYQFNDDNSLVIQAGEGQEFHATWTYNSETNTINCQANSRPVSFQYIGNDQFEMIDSIGENRLITTIEKR